MAKPYKLLREKMSPEARKKAEAGTLEMLREMRLGELRRARSLSQEQIAENLSINQAAVSKMERRTDMYISTLRDFVQAMGGCLEITARFPDGDIKINQFEELNSPE
ncbi:MAG: XRE family transcriptional regulator [Desulfobacterales bacterium]|nr:XRE family transcriptional regulator [Desulfobacterales bacterium]